MATHSRRSWLIHPGFSTLGIADLPITTYAEGVGKHLRRKTLSEKQEVNYLHTAPRRREPLAADGLALDSP